MVSVRLQHGTKLASLCLQCKDYNANIKVNAYIISKKNAFSHTFFIGRQIYKYMLENAVSNATLEKSIKDNSIF